MEAGILNRLKLSLQGLAAPAEHQLTIYPDGVAKVDELALDYSHWCEPALSDDRSDFTSSQRTLLMEVGDLLNRMSGEANAHLWTGSALRERPEWERVRREAKKTLEECGWPGDLPPPTDDFFANRHGPLNY